jgi:hypothetical protein
MSRHDDGVGGYSASWIQPKTGGQTRRGSLVEAGANIAVGFWVNYLANLCIFPLFGMHISLSHNLLLGAIYTCISLIRSYVLRRWFNGLKFGNAPS